MFPPQSNPSFHPGSSVQHRAAWETRELQQAGQHGNQHVGSGSNDSDSPVLAAFSVGRNMQGPAFQAMSLELDVADVADAAGGADESDESELPFQPFGTAISTKPGAPTPTTQSGIGATDTPSGDRLVRIVAPMGASSTFIQGAKLPARSVSQPSKTQISQMGRRIISRRVPLQSALPALQASDTQASSTGLLQRMTGSKQSQASWIPPGRADPSRALMRCADTETRRRSLPPTYKFNSQPQSRKGKLFSDDESDSD